MFNRYVLFRTESSGYGNHTEVIREFYSIDALEKYMKEIEDIVVSQGYDVRKQGNDLIVTNHEYERVTYQYKTITVDDEGAPWNVKH